MNAARLEELAVWCDRQNESLHFNQITDIAANFSDLARCARFAAELEKAMLASKTPVELMGYLGRVDHWAWHSGGPLERQGRGPTAIEAVEATEVKP